MDENRSMQQVVPERIETRNVSRVDIRLVLEDLQRTVNKRARRGVVVEQKHVDEVMKRAWPV